MSGSGAVGGSEVVGREEGLTGEARGGWREGRGKARCISGPPRRDRDPKEAGRWVPGDIKGTWRLGPSSSARRAVGTRRAKTMEV